MVFAVAALSRIDAQETRTFDLRDAAASDTVTVKPGRYQFSVTSLVPKHGYVVAISQGVEEIGPIHFLAPGAGAPLPRPSCQGLIKATSALGAATEEPEIAGLIQQVEAAIESLPNPSECQPQIDEAARVKAKTKRIDKDVYNLAAGDYVIVDVSRIEGGIAKPRWKRRYTTGAVGAWRVTYGYAFPALWRFSGGDTHLIREGRQFFARQVGDTGSVYVIDQQRRTRQFDAVPTVMFSFAPQHEGRFTRSWVGGLAADITKPVVFFGPSITYRSNLQLAGGAAFREEKVPIARYSIGDTVRTNLTTEQLQQDEFRLRPFVSITLRFDKNPFKKEAAEPAADQKPAEKPADKPKAK